MSGIEIRGISKRFKNTTVVDNVSLKIEDGDFLVLLGPSGCGKTTLLRMIAGLLEPSDGSIHLDETDITKLPAQKRDIAMVFQSYALYPHLSVYQNLAFPLKVQKLTKEQIKERVVEASRLLEIEHLLERKPKELSGGQRQRVAVGRSIVRNPKAFLMDEPLSNLDAKLRTQTRHELTALHRKLGATFVYVTHDQIEAMTMATKIALLGNGKLEQLGTPEEIYSKPASTFVAGFVGSPSMNLLTVRVHSENEVIQLEADGVSAALWHGQTEEFEATVGIRPEHLVLSSEAKRQEPGITITAVVDTVEKLGHEFIYYLALADTRIAVRASALGTAQFEEGQIVYAHAPEAQIHLFDGNSGKRLEWVAELEENPELVTSIS